MSSFKKHFPNFSLQKQQQQDLMHLSSNGHQRGSSHDNGRIDGELKSNLRHSNPMDAREVSIDVLSFKSDIFNCLDMCTAYIQALNTLCSTGAVLAQNLTQVFSRDVNVDGDNLVSKSTTNSGSNKISRRGLFGLKNSRRGEGIRTNASSVDELDSNYYEVAEQFLQVWETMSVSTAGASATIKTDTLMTLQDILNNLEQENKCSKTADLEGNNLEKSVRAAKTCLLAYIELQTQFSYKSWKSLNHLSKVLKSDPSMADVVNNVKKHFSSNSSEFHSQNDPDVPKGAVLRDEKRMKKPAKDGSNSTLESAINLLSLESVGSRSGGSRSGGSRSGGCSEGRKRRNHSRSSKVSRGSRVPITNSSKVTSSQFLQKQEPFEQGVTSSQYSQKQEPLQSFEQGVTSSKYSQKQEPLQPFEQGVSSSQYSQKQEPLQPFEQGVPTSGSGNSAIRMKQSTWPGKEVTISGKRNEFPRVADDWCMWPDLQSRSSDLFNDGGIKTNGTDAFLLPWNTFSSNSSSASSNSTIDGSSICPTDQLNIGRGMSSNSTIDGVPIHPTDQVDVDRRMTLPTTSNNRSHFEAFSHQGGPGKIPSFPERNNSRPAFNGLLDDRTNLSVIELAKKLSLSNGGGKDLVFSNNGGGKDLVFLNNAGGKDLAFDSPTGYFATDPFAPSTAVNATQLPHSLDTSRTSKTSTWPMKQANGFNGNVDWLPPAFDSFDLAPRFFHSDPNYNHPDPNYNHPDPNYNHPDPAYNQGSSSPWSFDGLVKQSSVSDSASKVSTGFSNLFTNSESNNNGHF